MDSSQISTLAGSATSLRSGTGAPIFEQAGQTRIRRNPVRAIASLTWEGGPDQIFGQILNVSLTGCLLKTETTIADATELDITVTILGGIENDDFDVRAVVRRKTTSDGRQAYGLEFVSDNRQQKEAVQGLYSATAR